MAMMALVIVGFKGTARRSWDFGWESAEFVKKVAWGAWSIKFGASFQQKSVCILYRLVDMQVPHVLCL